MPKIVDHENQREMIRSAAWKVFSRRGVKGTGLIHIAEEAGIGRASLYHYFRDKDSLLSDLADDLLQREEATFASVLESDAPPQVRIHRLIDALTTGFRPWSKLGAAAFDLRGLRKAHFRDFYRKTRALLGSVIGEGQTSGAFDPTLDSGEAADLVIGLVDGMLLLYVAEPARFPKATERWDPLHRAVDRILES